jgi:hypothetical protein
MRAEFLVSSDPRWEEFLEACHHDFYHLPGYVELCARQEGGEPVAFLASEGACGLLVPMVLRPLPEALDPSRGWRDAAAPYGYPCPLLRGDPDEAAVAGFLAAFSDLGAAAGIVSAFIRLHPILELPLRPFGAFGTLVDEGQTVLLDLTRPREELMRQTRANHLADARRLERDGFRVVLDDWSWMADFVRIYEETMAYRDAGSFYRFGPAYFHDLRQCLGDRLHLCLVQDPDGEAAAAGLFTRVDGLMQFHLSGTSAAHRRIGPAKLMLLHMRDWAKAKGVHTLHLGGGVGCREDSLAFFKQGFSKLRGRYRTFRMVLVPDLYRDLVRQLEPAGAPGTGADPDPARDFFPAYRRSPSPIQGGPPCLTPR